MINEALHLTREFYKGVLGVNAKRLLVPLVAPDAVTVEIEVHAEIDTDGPGNGTANGRNLAMGDLAVPAAGKIALGLSLARPGPGIDSSSLPPVRTHEVPILHTFTRRNADGVKALRQLSYAYRATLWTLEEFKQPAQAAARQMGDVPSEKLIQLIELRDVVTIPAYRAVEDTICTLAFVAVWRTRDTKPRGV